MRHLLLFPPFWTATQPYLSLPSLTAYLKQMGHEVQQRDLNLEFIYWLAQSKVITSLYDDVEPALQGGDELSLVLNTIKEDLIKNGESYIDDIRKKELFYSSDSDKYKKAQNMINYLYRLISHKYHPQAISPKGYDIGREVVNVVQLFEILEDFDENMFYEFYRKVLMEKDFVNYGLIGISIIGQEQLIPALVLCKILKKLYPTIPVCVGGPIITRLKATIEENPQFFSVFDFAIMYEGEYPLLALGEALEGKMELKDVPNLIYYLKEENKAYYTFTGKGLTMDHIPTPDFEGLKLDKYLSPEVSLPLLTTRGCYWNKCSFCDHSYIYNNNFRLRKIENVIRDIQLLKEKYDIKYINFVDECIPPKIFKGLAYQLDTLPFKIYWHGAIRFEKTFIDQELLKRAYASGLRVLFYGFESGCQRVLDLMNKGTDCDDIEKILEVTSQAGIWNHLFTIFGFPTESLEELMTTREFINRNKKHINSVGFARFSLNKSSPIAFNPTKYSIRKIKPKGEIALNLNYDCIEGIEKNQLLELQEVNDKEGFPIEPHYHRFIQTFHRDLWYMYLSKYGVADVEGNFAEFKGEIQQTKDFITSNSKIRINQYIIVSHNKLKKRCFVFDPLKAKFLELSDSVGEVLSRLREPIKIDEIAKTLSDEHGVPFESVSTELITFLNELKDRNIVEITE